MTTHAPTVQSGVPPHLLRAAYATQFFASLHLFSVLYIASSYLAQTLGKSWVPWLVGAGALAALVSILFAAPRFAQKAQYFPHYLAWWVIVEALLYAVLWLGDQAPPSLSLVAAISLAFVATQATYLLGVYGIDLALEAAIGAHEEMTGRIRTTALTLMNAALLVAAALSPWLVGHWGYGAAYFLGFLALLPTLWFGRRLTVAIGSPSQTSLVETLQFVWREKPLRDAYILQIGLRLFYAWMVVYTPLYLHATLGFSWQELSLPFVVMLSPFVLFERIVGWLADTRWGEREFIVVGFLIMAASLLLFPFLGEAPLAVWTLVLFASRTGAALVEAATESYFFKHISTDGGVVVAFFRSTRPVAFFLSGVLGGLAMLLADIAASFVLLAVLMFAWGVYALGLRDTQPQRATA